MDKMGRAAGALFLLVLLLGVFRVSIIDGIHGVRTIDTTQLSAVSVAIDSANVTLAHDLFQANLSEVITITTNITGAPAPATYTEASKVLLIAGLDPGTQTLTIRYYAETDDSFMRIIGPFLVFLVFVGLTGLIIWAAIKGGKGRR